MSIEYPNRINGNGNKNSSTIAETEEVANNKPKLDERFLANIQGKEFVLYAGLLDLAHQHGLMKLEVEYIQLPTIENNHTAICKATATTKDGKVFSDVADANPTNVNKKIAPHILRMASTRAKARVLRDATNVGITALEELGELDEALEEPAPQSAPGNRRSYRNGQRNGTNDSRTERSTPNTDISKPPSNTSNTSNGAAPKMSEAQRRAVFNLASRRALTDDALKATVQERFNKPLESLSSSDAASLIRYLQQAS